MLQITYNNQHLKNVNNPTNDSLLCYINVALGNESHLIVLHPCSHITLLKATTSNFHPDDYCVVDANRVMVEEKESAEVIRKQWVILFAQRGFKRNYLMRRAGRQKIISIWQK